MSLKNSMYSLALMLTLAVSGSAWAQSSGQGGPSAVTRAAVASEDLPVDPNVRIGTLPNGVRYYIRHNEEPENRAELRLAIDAGTALEDPDQGGVAHFLEHMLFNGTRRFPKMELVNFLERTGMKFGAHVNAYTSLDETVYMLTIPTDSNEIVQGAFDVLEDWASYATLSDEEIDKERGVIIEEWRARRENVQGRIQERVVPALLGDSKYTEQFLAYRPEVIQELDYDAIRRFYRDWYRPDLMAVVVVGDVDVDRYEQLIREHFSDLPSPEAPRARPELDVPGIEDTRYTIVTDPEYPYTTIGVNFLRDAERGNSVVSYRESLLKSLFNSMLNNRLDEIAREPDAAFLGAGVSRGGLVRPTTIYGLSAQTHEDSLLQGFEAILTEAARVRRHGFTQTELERQKAEVLRAYQRAYNERENTNSAAYASEYISNFLEDEPIPGIAYEYELVQELLPGIHTEDVNQLAGELLSDSNRVVIVTMPEKQGLTPPTEEQLAAVFERVQNQEVEPYVDAVSDQPLLSEVPEPAAAVAERTLPEIGVTEVTLANGVRVVMKPTDFKEDEVSFTAFSPGGSSLVSDEHEFDAETATALVEQSGVGAFSPTDLQKLLAGKVVSVEPYIGELEEGLSGGASPEDLETLFQLIHLYFTEPRADSSALAMIQNQYRAYLMNRSANPQAAFQDSLQAALFGKHPRREVPTIEDVNDLSLSDAYGIYQDRFADAGDFTFVFVGNFDTERLTELARTYLGTLPSTDRVETWRDVYPDYPEDVVTKDVVKGSDERSQVALVFTGPFEYDRENRHAIRTMADVLSIMLREELREERGGVYGVGVNASASDEPDSTYSVSVSFTTAPERVDELVDAIFDQMEKLKTEGPSADNLAKVREQQRRERETQLKTNAFWLGVLDYYYSQDTEDVLDVLRYDELIQGITAEDVQDAARTYLNDDRYVKVVLYPEDFQQ